MIYLAIDTCVWLELLKVDFNQEDNPFDEMLYWIEYDMITLVTTENLVAEWNRHKHSKKHQVLDAFKNVNNSFTNLISAAHPMKSIYAPNKVQDVLRQRIDRVDMLLSGKAHIAPENDDIYIEAAKRNLRCFAPNHDKDSFRDTVNILTLKYYVKQKGFKKCAFTTINYTDYSERISRDEIHNQLKKDFEDADMQYIYFNTNPDNFAGKLYNQILRPFLPKFQDFLRTKHAKIEEKKIEEKKLEREKLKDVLDPNFLPYTFEIDRILQKENRTDLDDNILKFLFDKNPKYEHYFLRKLTEYGLV
ncbi:PIN domain-containing protein [Flavobacterium sp. LB2R40]|uniref:PIN domain-containing protein n=1 Tax=Flavobacterium sp. LB2R40 TaxID=3401722 RepID=UPI003AAE7726